MPKSIDDYELAMTLIALLYLGGSRRTFPDHSGYLDHGLRDCIDGLPKSLAKSLSFSFTNVGLRCCELPMILQCALEIGLIEWTGFSMDSFTLKISREDARMNAVAADHSTADFEIMGAALVSAIELDEQNRKTR
jgi:hypothetical protein